MVSPVTLFPLLLSWVAAFAGLLADFPEEAKALRIWLDSSRWRMMRVITPAGRVLMGYEAATPLYLTPGAERRRYLTFIDELHAAGGDESVADAATTRYLREAAPNGGWNQIAYARILTLRGGDRHEEMLALSRRAKSEGTDEGTRLVGHEGEISALMNLGRREEAMAATLALPQAGVGGTDTSAKATFAYMRSSFLNKLGRPEAARLSFLSQMPPDGLDHPVRGEFARRAAMLQTELMLFGGSNYALEFGTALLEKRPDLVPLDMLQNTASLAERSGRPDQAARLREYLIDLAPGTTFAHTALDQWASAAREAGDVETARRLYDRLLDDATADFDLREKAVRALNRLDPGLPAERRREIQRLLEERRAKERAESIVPRPLDPDALPLPQGARGEPDAAGS